jgi:hypothetical protein
MQTVVDLCLVQESHNSDDWKSVEGVHNNMRAASSKAHVSTYTTNPTVLHFEFGKDVERNLQSRTTSLWSNVGQPDCSRHLVIVSRDSGLLQEGDNMNGEIAAKHNASYDVTVARSKLHALSNSDPNLLYSWEIESAEKHQSSLSEGLSVSSRDVSLSGSVPNLVPLRKNGKSRKRNGFTLVKLKSEIFGLKTECGAIFSSLTNFFPIRNSSEHSRYKHTCVSKSEESRKNPRHGEEIFRAPKLHHVMEPTGQDDGMLVAADTPSPVVILRSHGVAHMQTVTPQEQEEATSEQSLYDIEWSFPDSRKKSWSHIAKFALNSPLSNDRQQQMARLLRPRSSPAHICKSLQHLSVLCQHTVVSPCFVVMFVMWRGAIVPPNRWILPFSCIVILVSLLCSSVDNTFCDQNVFRYIFSHPTYLQVMYRNVSPRKSIVDPDRQNSFRLSSSSL